MFVFDSKCLRLEPILLLAFALGVTTVALLGGGGGATAAATGTEWRAADVLPRFLFRKLNMAAAAVSQAVQSIQSKHTDSKRLLDQRFHFRSCFRFVHLGN
jgi:hypothetical protein